MTFCRFHCRACGGHFTSLQAFDAHRAGSYRQNTRRCIDPVEVTGRSAMAEAVGMCRISRGHGHPYYPVTVWQLERHQNPAPARRTLFDAPARVETRDGVSARTAGGGRGAPAARTRDGDRVADAAGSA